MGAHCVRCQIPIPLLAWTRNGWKRESYFFIFFIKKVWISYWILLCVWWTLLKSFKLSNFDHMSFSKSFDASIAQQTFGTLHMGATT